MREKPRRTNMQRPIKFRAWDTQLGRWADLPNLYSRAKVNLKDSGGEDKEVLDLTTFTKRLIFVQFTGQHDKNGVEIYEGDIFIPWDDERVYVITWDEDYAGFKCEQPYGKYWPCDMNLLHFHGEVIGNIYENPELLDGNKD